MQEINGVTHVKVASFGCGVDSIAGLIIAFFAGVKYDEILFCDTGSEKQETYLYLDYLIKTLRWPITIVHSKYGPIYDYYFKKRIYPTRWARDCTGKFKIDRFNNYLRTKYGKLAHFDVDIFIDYSEGDRVRESKYNYSTLHYPLIDLKLVRSQLKEIIKACGMPEVTKSGCFFCPFTPPAVWLKMKQSPKGSTDREYYEKAIAMEKNSRMRDKRKYPLVVLKSKGQESDLFSCGCFNYNTDEQANEKVMEEQAEDLDSLWTKPF